MKTVKAVSEITGVSIRTLRFYDEIGLLKPAQITDAGYRLYDSSALERLQEIMFYRELGMPLNDIKKIMENPGHGRKQALFTQKALLEKKRNHLNGIIEFISDVMEGANTMSFGTFNKDDVQKIIDHTLQYMPEDVLQEQVKQHGGEAEYREYLANGFANEQATAELIKWYGSKEKAMGAILQATGDREELQQEQDENRQIYSQFIAARNADDAKLAQEAVGKLAGNYKKMFQLDNARNILICLAKEYLRKEKLAEGTDRAFGAGISEFVANEIFKYYGI